MPVTAPRRRRVRRNKTPELSTAIVLQHIVPRLPAKSVIRLMTVSKEFHSFLKTHQFARMHLHHVTNDDHRHKFLVLSIEQGRWLFSSIDCETTTTTPDGCLITPPPSRPVPFLTSCPPYMQVLSSFHGLVCVGIFHALEHDEYNDLILWNPATGDYKILSKSIVVLRSCYEGFGLYYSCGDDDYKLLHVNRRCEVYMYSLRFDSWRKLVVGLEDRFCSTQSVWLNENLYFLDGFFNSVIMRFDTITENIEVMRLPRESLVKDVRKSLFVHEGYIHLCVRFEENYGSVIYDTWKMNGDGDWSMVDTYNMDKISLARRLKRRPHLMRNGEWLMIHPNKYCTDCILYMFDPEKKAYTYTHLGITGFIPAEGRYTETLVSPNQYNIF